MEKEVNNLVFPINDSKISEILNAIILNPKTGSEIDFLVTIKNKEITDQKTRFRIGNLNFRCVGNEFFIKIEGQELNDNLRNGDQIFTSFTIHCPSNF